MLKGRTRLANYVVSVELPPYVTAEKMRKYIEDEIKSGVGFCHPLDPMFNLDRNKVKVSIRREVSAKKVQL